jgi:hypothetical protein
MSFVPQKYHQILGNDRESLCIITPSYKKNIIDADQFSSRRPLLSSEVSAEDAFSFFFR